MTFPTTENEINKSRPYIRSKDKCNIDINSIRRSCPTDCRQIGFMMGVVGIVLSTGPVFGGVRFILVGVVVGVVVCGRLGVLLLPSPLRDCSRPGVLLPPALLVLPPRFTIRPRTPTSSAASSKLSSSIPSCAL